jgi:hypothetical protein
MCVEVKRCSDHRNVFNHICMHMYTYIYIEYTHKSRDADKMCYVQCICNDGYVKRGEECVNAGKLCLCVHIYTCMYVCVYIYIYIYIYMECVNAGKLCVCAHIHTHAHVYVCVFIMYVWGV